MMIMQSEEMTYIRQASNYVVLYQSAVTTTWMDLGYADKGYADGP